MIRYLLICSAFTGIRDNREAIIGFVLCFLFEQNTEIHTCNETVTYIIVLDDSLSEVNEKRKLIHARGSQRFNLTLRARNSFGVSEKFTIMETAPILGK